MDANHDDQAAAGNRPEHDRHEAQQIDAGAAQAYWRANLRLLGMLLVVWFSVSFGFGILLVGPLNGITLFGFKLGFWWAQQGAIYVFVVLIFVYAWRMKAIDRRHGVDDDD